MSVRIRPGDESAWQWAAEGGQAGADAAVQDDGEDAWLHRPERGLAPRPGWARIVAGVVIAAVVLLVLGGLVVRLAAPAPPAQAPAAAPPTSLAPSPTATASAAAASPSAPGADTMAVPWQGAALPVSDSAGPAVFTKRRSTGFTRDPQGAALAAVHISTHMDPLTGPAVFTPTIEEQVLGAEELMAQTLEQYQAAARARGLGPRAVASGVPVLAPTGDISRWRIRHFRPGGVSTVELLVATPQGQQVVYQVPVVWRDGDWRVTFEGSDRGATLLVSPARSIDDFTPFITRGNVHHKGE